MLKQKAWTVQAGLCISAGRKELVGDGKMKLPLKNGQI